jgi:pimeloyl-ACP methyl ester carboxylesterase
VVERVDSNGLEFSVVVDGPGNGPPVVLLHGWPDSSRVWRHQVPALAAAGFRVLAPDLRGFGDSDRPEGTAAYRSRTLCGDVTGILDAFGVERAAVVGHDWGAALAWLLASVFAADRVDRLAVLAAGHPEALRRAGLRQLRRSWYVLLFQWKGVAERWLSKDDWAYFRRFCAAAGYPDRDTDAAVAEFSRPGALTAGLEWYRANWTPKSLVAPPLRLPPVRCPTLGIWGAGDPALTEKQMRDSAAYVTGGWRYERFDESGHWPQLDAPERTNALLLEFLAPGSG